MQIYILFFSPDSIDCGVKSIYIMSQKGGREVVCCEEK